MSKSKKQIVRTINLTRYNEDRRRREDDESAKRIAQYPSEAANQQAAKDTILSQATTHDGARLKTIAKEIRDLPNQFRQGPGEGVGFTLILDAIRNGAFSGDQWISFRHKLASAPCFGSVAVLLGSNPKPGMFKENCNVVADAIEHGVNPKAKTANLIGNAKTIADYIDANPGSAVKDIHGGTTINEGSIRTVIKNKLKPLGYFNNRDGKGYFPPP